MAINPYDQAVWSQYTPLSAQEILQPAMIMGERQMQLENEYAALGDTASQLAFIAETETDPNIKAKYTNYMNQINQGINTLRDRGINPNTRAQMLDLKSKFQSELAPIKAGYELKLQDVTNHNQMRMKDPTWIGIDPNSRSVSDYINNGLMPMATEGISGAMVTAQAAEMAKGYQHILNSDNPTALMIDQFGPQYQEFRRGLSPETDDFEAAMQYIENTILGASASQLDWAKDATGQLDANVAQQLSNSVRMGMNNAMGKSEVLRDQGRDFRMQQQLLRDAAKGRETPPTGMTPTPIAGSDLPGQSLKASAISTAFGLTKEPSVLDLEFNPQAALDYTAKNIVSGDPKKIVGNDAKLANDFYNELMKMDPKELEDLDKELDRMAKESNVPTNYDSVGYMGEALVPATGMKLASTIANKVGALATAGALSTAGMAVGLGAVLSVPSERKADIGEAMKIASRAYELQQAETEVNEYAKKLGGNPKEVAEAMNKFYDNRKVVSGDSYKYMDNSINSQANTDALTGMQDLASAGTKIFKNENGVKGNKEISLKKLDDNTKYDIANATDKSVHGVQILDGKAYHKVVITDKKGDIYTVLKPSLSIQENFPLTYTINEIVNQGVYEPVTFIGPEDKEVKVIPTYDKNTKTYNVFVEFDGKRATIEDVQKAELQAETGRLHQQSASWTNAGTTMAQ